MTSLLQKLTIAIPVYNDAGFIEATVRSCAGQAGRVLVADNASTDATGDICRRLAAELPAVEYIRHAENIGAFGNFRFCLDACESEYFMWLGSHDQIADGYAGALLQGLEAAPGAGLAIGRIRYFDENGAFLQKVTTSEWADRTQAVSAVDRVHACVAGLRRDCFAFYNIFRTEVLRRAWMDTPGLGFDRAVLARAAGIAPVIYCPAGEMHAREFVHTRNPAEDRDRRVREVGAAGAAPLAKDTVMRNKAMAQAALDAAETPEDLSRAFAVIAYIDRRYQNRRRYQRRRLALIAAVVLAACAAAWWLIRA